MPLSEGARRWALRSVFGLALAVTFVGATVLGIALHANRPVVRRLLAHAASSGLSRVLRGRVEMDAFSRISPRSLRVPSATLFDVYGRRVLTLHRMRIGFDPLILATQLFSREGSLTVIVPRVRVERAEAELVPDPTTGEPTIVGAFAPRPSAAPSGGASPGRSVRLYLPSIEVGAARLHATFRDVPPLEAAVSHLHGQLVATEAGVAVDVTRFGAVLSGFGANARGTGTFGVRAPGTTHGTFEGFVGDVEIGASALIRGSHVELSADMPGASPAAIRRFLPDWPVVEPVSAHVEAKGDYPNLRASAMVTAGSAIATADGTLVLGQRRRATLKVSGEHIDARAFSARAPTTDVAVTGDLDATDDNGTFSAAIRTHTAETELSGFPIPAIDAEMAVEGGKVSGTADIHEPGMPTRAKFSVESNGVVEVDAESKAVDFQRVTPLSRRGLRGRGGARLRARVEKGNLTASLDATTGHVEIASVSAAESRISVQAHGPLEFPEKLQGAVHVAAKSLARGAFSVDEMELNAKGSLTEATFDAAARETDGPDVDVSGTLAVLGHPLIRDAKVALRRDPVLVEGRIAAYDPDTAELDVRDIRATGAGGPLTGSARLRPNLVEVEAQGENLNLDALARALALPRGTLGGRGRVSLTLEAGRDVTRGHVRLGAGNLTIGTVGGISTEIFADLDGERLSGGASGLVNGIGTFGASWDVTLGGPAFELASYPKATGKAELQLSDVELKRLDVFLPESSPILGVEGRGYARLDFQRTSARAAVPNLTVTAATRDLALVLRGAAWGKPLRIDGIDLNTSGSFDGATGDTSGSTIAMDSHGVLASCTGTLRVDVPRLLGAPERALSQLLETPIEARASVPARGLADFPAFMKPEGVDGEVGGDLLVTGTLSHPTLRSGIDGRAIIAKGSRVPVDAHAEVEYEWATRALRGRADARIAGQPVASAVVAGTLPSASPEDFRGGARLELDGLPFDLIGALSANAVRGRVFGTATLSTLEGGGALSADLRVVDAVVDRTPLGEGNCHVSADGRAMTATLKFWGRYGSLDATASAGIAWNGPFPSLSAEAPLHGHVATKDFGAAALSPFVNGVLSRLGGRIDANVDVALAPKSGDTDHGKWSGEIDGSAALHDGTALIDVLGLDLRNLTLRAQASGKNGKTRITVAELKGSIRSNADNVHGSAELDLDGIELVAGKASLYADDVPVLFRGAPQGRATGTAKLELTREADRMLVDVDVPTLALALPESSSRTVIDVTDNPDIVIVQNAEPTEKRENALPWRLLVHLGNSVSLHRSDIELKVTGTPVVNLGAETEVTGSVELVPGGHLPILGQVFAIDHGVITFDTGAPDNPTVNVTAGWRAADDTMVYVDVTGTLKESQVALRSDPPMPERDVFALLFGGSSSDTATAEPGSGGGQSAAGTAALQGPVQQLNRLFGQSPVELRVGSTSEAQPRYTAAVRVRENLWFEASTYQQSDYTGGSSSDRNVVSGTIDYRFSRKWSLRTEAGTVGGALDLLWQHTY